tara:strand:+ start:825 stop:1313 length:489 start_codon:yes stop_codon:yes gene_type:complete
MEVNLKKILLVTLLIIFIFSCGDSEAKIIEPLLTNTTIEFPEEELDDGAFGAIFRNYHDDSVQITVIMLRDSIIPDSSTLDFCMGVDAIRNGKGVKEWTPINFNMNMISENNVPNQNDHPNLISYNLPVGTYLVMLMNADSCNRENYDVFDVTRNKSYEGLQ